MTQPSQFFATCPKGLELLLKQELLDLGADTAHEKLAGVAFTGGYGLAYKGCLWSRLANAILMPIAQFEVNDPSDLYEGVKKINWDAHIPQDGNFAIRFSSKSSVISHTLYGAQKVKDAIVDQFREKFGSRPDVKTDEPDVAIHVYLKQSIATISIDFSGTSLHKRSYRLEGGAASLKENLASGILIRAGWPQIAKQRGKFVDLMCGSGTLLIEAAMIAGNIAPGLKRHYFGFLKWKQFQQPIWDDLYKEATEAAHAGLKNIPSIYGFDESKEAVYITKKNCENAGLTSYIHVETKELSKHKDVFTGSGLVMVNPPYGERLDEVENLKSTYELLGTQFKTLFPNWSAAVFTGVPQLGKTMGIKAKKYYQFFNGTIPCQLLLFQIKDEYFVDRSLTIQNRKLIYEAQKNVQNQSVEAHKAIQAFTNRLIKNIKKLKDSAETQCLYDRDLPDYVFKIERKQQHIYVSEYEAPKEISELKLSFKRDQVLAVLPDVLKVSPETIFFNTMKLSK